MRTIPKLENEFYHDGRGPELQKIFWRLGGAYPEGFTYFNPDDVYDEKNIKHLKLEKVEAYMVAGDEVHPNILCTGESKAAIYEVIDSEWLKQFKSPHVADCRHFQIVFYDEVFDIICKNIKAGNGPI